MIADDPTLPPRYVIEHYRKAYLSVNGREPLARYMGNHWFKINGETVHRSTLMEEIARLRTLAQARAMAQAQSLQSSNKSIIQRLISRLKNL